MTGPDARRRTDETLRIEIRRVDPADWRAVRILRLKALETDPLAFASTLERESKFEDSLWIDRVSRGASSSTSATYVAAIEDGSLVGMTGTFSEGSTTSIVGMWVAPEYRRHGLGSKLLDAVLLWIRTVRPGDEVKLDVNPTQKVAVRLYRSRGFLPTGSVEPLGHTPGALVHAMVLGTVRSVWG